MGIDYSGGMIIGESGCRIAQEDFDSLNEWAEENDMEIMSTFYDADEENCYYGFPLPNINVSEMNDDWLKDVRDKATKFELLAGVPAKLIGTQNIW